jgi:hypothetical protein
MSKQWAQPTWIFFHTFIEQINDNFYQQNCKTILQYIKNVCSVLPCPYCQEHAMEYMKRIQPKHVKTRKEMRNMLFEFHNRVNLRLHKPLFQESHLEKYARIDFIKVIKQFQFVMTKNYTLNRSFNEHMMRKRIIQNIFKFLQSNIKQFKRK